MNTHKLSMAFIIGMLTVFFITSSWAGPSAGKYPLMATKMHPGAEGTAIITDENIRITAKGLKPNSVYTVWFVNMKPKKHEAGAGTAPYMFKTDAISYHHFQRMGISNPSPLMFSRYA
ncbi:MAG: hypothetical protein JRJ04_13065 [Deltaproteobacteria bacterium]|nr:hypothetical protein [Deltaproteobacteria bacterium]